MGVTVMTSVLFTDLVDSTAMAARLGPEAADDLRHTHFGLLRGVIAANEGNEVKNLGDGLMVTFASPSRALACATAIQQVVERHNRRAAEPLGIRIGVSVGEATEEDGDYFGDTVVEAARLCAAAAGGQILATDLVRAMVGRHAPQTFEALGALELKGLPELVQTVGVSWDPLTLDGLVPLPNALSAATRQVDFGFVGRTSELRLLADATKVAFAEPQLQTVLVGGEAGIGKTSLIARAADAAHADGATVLLGHCDEDLTVPYQPWIEALSHLVEYLGIDCVNVLSPLHRSTIARLIPVLGGQDWNRPEGVDSERLVLMHAVSLLLHEVSRDAPVVVVLDDLHWADAASVQLLRHLVTVAEPMAVLLLGTYRHTDLGRDHPLTSLLADMHRQTGVSRLRLSGLGDDETVELISGFSGHSLEGDVLQLAHALHRETDGNPFFTRELLRHLDESGVVYADAEGRWAVKGDFGAGSLPASIRDVVARRVSMLGSEALRILSFAAVVGRSFSLDVVAEVVDRSVDDVLDVLDAATAAAVVSETDGAPGSFRFVHALIQRTLYEDLAAARRVRIHQRIAEAIEAQAGDDPNRTAELARHWVAAIRPAEVDTALHYVVRAADEALAALAPDDAIAWYQQALDLLPPTGNVGGPKRGRILVGLGTAQRHIGAPEHRDSLLEAVGLARATGDADLLVAAVLAVDRGIAGTSVSDVEWVDATSAALDAIGVEDSANRARLLAVLSQVIDARDWQRRRELSIEAIEVARRVADEATLLAVLPVAHQHYGPEELDKRLANTALAIDLADRLGDPVAHCNALFHGIDASMQDADIDTVDQRIATFTSVAESLGLPLHLWQLQMILSGRALVDGRMDDAEVAATDALKTGTEAGYAEATLAYGAQIIEIRRQQGRLGELIGALEHAGGDMDEATGFRQLMASVYTELDRIDDAYRLLAPDLASDFANIPLDEGWLAVMLSCVGPAAALRDQRACQTLYDRVLPYERGVAAVYAWIIGSPARSLGVLATALGQFEVAEAHFGVALETNAHIRAPYWTARTQLELADMLQERGGTDDLSRAKVLTQDAHEVAQAHGYLGLLSR